MTLGSAASMYDRTTIQWGRSSEMTAVEASMWHVSAVAMLRAASVVVEVLDAVPDWERFVSGHAWALACVPRLRQRVVSDPLRLGPPAWADTRVDLGYHLRRVKLTPGAALADVLLVASTMHEETFDPERPLWEAALVEGLRGKRAAYVLKLHHAMADDRAVVSLFDLIHSHVRSPTARTPQLPAGAHEPGTPLQLAGRHALNAPGRLAAATLRTGASVVRHPVRGVEHSLHLARSAGNTLSAGGVASTSPLRARGSHRAFAAIAVPTERLRAAGRAAGGRQSDAMLAVVVDGLVRYHDALGVPVGELPIAVPLHRRFDGSDGETVQARITVPTAPTGAAQRITDLHIRINAAQGQQRFDTVRAFAPATSRAPARLVARVIRRFTGPLALQAFVIPGLQRDAFLAGAQVLQMFSFSPTQGCALSATLLTHQQTSCLAFNYDTAAVTDTALLSRCLHEALDGVLALKPTGATIARQSSQR